MPHYCSIVNFYLYTSNFSTIFKHALVTPLLKKSNLDCSNFSNYRPMCARNVRKWFILNNLFPNSSKTKLLKITLKPFIFPTITFDYTVIIPSDCAESLGVILDKN